jgi:DNA-binding HxlR family transcriptional regulator
MDTLNCVGALPDLRKLGGANAFHRSCASQTVLDVLSNKWAALIIVALRGGELRFSVLKRTLDGITQKSLTQGLRHLERDGLITRTVYPTIPPRVDYALTDLGRSVSGLLDEIKTWSEQNLPEILEARTAYDTRTAEPAQPITAASIAP